MFKQTKDEYVYKQHEKAAKDEQIVEWRFYFIIHKKIYHCVDYKYGNNRYYSQCSDFIDGKSYIPDLVLDSLCDIKQSGWKWGDGNLIKNKCPDYVYMETSDDAEFPLDRERAGLVTLSVTKAKSDTTTLNITNIAFEICNNGTKFDMELFYELNPSIDSMDISLKEGESVL